MTEDKKTPIHAELSYALIGAAMELHGKLGPGWDEEAYHAALLHALSRQGIKAAKQIDLIFNSILRAHGLGYGAETYKKLFQTECMYQEIPCSIPVVTLQYEDITLGEREIGAFCLDSNILISVTALNEQSSAADMTRLLSYMRQTELHIGLLANFGRTSLDLRLLTQ